MGCTHQGTRVDISGHGFTCPNHGAQFSSTGAATRGAASQLLYRHDAVCDATAQTLVVSCLLRAGAVRDQREEAEHRDERQQRSGDDRQRVGIARSLVRSATGHPFHSGLGAGAVELDVIGDDARVRLPNGVRSGSRWTGRFPPSIGCKRRAAVAAPAPGPPRSPA